MLYSVWDWDRKSYRYYDSPNGERNGQRPQPRQKVDDPKGPGRQLETLLPVVPAGAKPAGAGTDAHGRVAVLSGGGFGFGADEPATSTTDALGKLVVPFVVAAGAIWVAKRVLMWAARSW